MRIVANNVASEEAKVLVRELSSVLAGLQQALVNVRKEEQELLSKIELLGDMLDHYRLQLPDLEPLR